MLKNAYILYLDEPKSLKYLEDCVDSCKQFPDINPIPVAGPLRATYKELCAEFGIGIIPYYINQMDTNAQTLNNTFSCNGGHYRIWKKIVESGEPGVVLEHDAVVKQSFTTVEPVDGEILWLGPRIHNMDDYKYPDGWEMKYVEVDRWEGTHAYAITPRTAQMLLDYIDEYGINDSIDGQLGMRNIFDMKMRAVDPPPVVAVVSGNRQSTIELSGNAATWNAYSTEGFRVGLKLGMEPPVRQLYFTDSSFMKQTGILNTIFCENGLYENKPVKVLVIGGKEGMSTLWLSNKLLRHDDSQLFCAGPFEKNNLEIFNFNTYFSKYYFKLNAIKADDITDLMVASCDDPEIEFDVVYIDAFLDTKNVIFNALTSYKMLKENGILIVNNYDNPRVKAGADIVYNTTTLGNLHSGDFAVYKY